MFSKRISLPQASSLRWSWVWLIVMAGLLFCQVYFFFLDTADTNADLFVWPYFLKDIFSGGFVWAKWTFPPSGYLFPDLPLCALLWFACGQDPMLTLFWQHILYAGLFVWGTASLIKRAFGWSVFHSWFSALFIALCLTHPLLLPRALMTGLMGPASKGQSTLMLLWGANVLCSFWQKSQRKYLFVLAAIAFLGCFGDRIFALWFVAPVMAIAFFNQRHALFWTVLIAGLLGTAAAYLITPGTHLLYTFTGTWRMIKESHLPSGWPMFVKDLGVFARTYPAMCVTLIISLFAGAFYLWRQRKKLPWHASGIAFLIFVPWALSLGLNIYDGAENWRHFPFIVFFGLLWMLALVKTPSKNWSVIFGSFIVLVSLPFTPLIFISTFPEIAYPHFVQDIDKIKNGVKLKDGLASYWFCKQTNLLTQAGTHLAPLWKDGRPNPVLSTLRDYENRDFNFIIVNILWEPQILERFGSPQQVFIIQNEAVHNRWDIYVYPDGFLNRHLAEDPLLQTLAQERRVKLQIADSQ